MALFWQSDAAMQSMSAWGAKSSFGELIDIARLEPVAIEKHGQAEVVRSIEAYERVQAVQHTTAEASHIELQNDELTRRQPAASTIVKLVGKGE